MYPENTENEQKKFIHCTYRNEIVKLKKQICQTIYFSITNT